ncbi:MAG: V-type ATPase subunit [Sedimentisphaerales bacterium]|nr:V-type ATPase subunit [Sedimentisphaerales bacterium]
MLITTEQPRIDFNTYPPIGGDDWRYTFATAKVRALETQLINRSTLLDMANAPDFASAVDSLSSTEYSVAGGGKDFNEVEEMLIARRSDIRKLFANLIMDDALLELLREKDDFANLRLALRRKLTDRQIGTDYSNEGSIPAEEFEQIFEQENYSPLPEYMQEGIECAVLSFYENEKNVRWIDFAIDNCQAHYKLAKVIELKNIFLEGLFRIQIDILNIKAMLRLKFTASELRDVFIEGGYLEIESLKHGLDIGFESVAALFAATPYFEIINSGASYLTSNNSFLKLEANCDKFVDGFLKQTSQITAGPQPLIAYLMTKEGEIRTLRLILTAKKNSLEPRLILDRLGE